MEEIKKIEQIVCEIYSISPNAFLSKKGQDKFIWEAYGLLVYILHNDYKTSIGNLSKYFGINQRNIKRKYSKYKFLVGNDKDVKEKYEEILNKIQTYQ